MAEPNALVRWTPAGLGPLRLACLLVVVLLVFSPGVKQAGSEPAPPSQPPLVGFSFSPYAVREGNDPVGAFRELLSRLEPDVVRLPVYWCDVMPEPGVYDFSKTNAFLAVVAEHNRLTPERPARVILVVGIRNIGYPEVWAPAWLEHQRLADLSGLVRAPDYLGYLRTTITRYATNPLLYAWQVENEPYDDVTSGLGRDNVSLRTGAVQSELRRVEQLDATHPAVITTYDSATVQLDLQATSRLSWLYQLLPGPKAVGHPTTALRAGDVLGLDAYVVTPTTPLDQASARQRINWKGAALAYWAGRAASAHKQLWITEMQAAPWLGAPGFTPDDLLQSARVYSRLSISMALLWGVEEWVGDEAWMQAGQSSVQTLRGGTGQPFPAVA